MQTIDWWSIVPAFIGALIPVLGLLATALIAWGRLTQKQRHQAEHQLATNGKVDAQTKKDSELEVAVSKIQATCAERHDLLVKNDREHSELFSRIQSLETGVAALPGKIIEKMDARFSDWRVTINSDIRNTIYAIDREKEHDRRREIRREYNPGRRDSNGHPIQSTQTTDTN
jgi:hypothetical protein